MAASTNGTPGKRGNANGMEEALRRIAEAKRTNAEELDIGGLGLTAIPGALLELTQLKVLHLGLCAEAAKKPDYERTEEDKKTCNAVSALPPALFTSLPHLNTLHLEHNRLEELPETIGQLSSLTQLWLDNNQLGSLPETIGQLSSLTQLWLRNNQLGSLPETIGQLSSLTWLDLRNNQLGSLPETIGQLSSLTKLWLDNNQLGSLPLFFAKFDRLRGKDDQGNPRFTVVGNPLPSFPEGLADSGDAVLDFLAGLEEGPKLCNEVKTILVGDGKAGKTTLLYRLRDNEFINDRPETVALEIGHYDIVPPDGNGAPLHLNVWDFGGQDDYRSTQQFFFTPHALYLFLWDRRLNVDTSNVRRWLSLVNKRAGRVKVLMIATHCCEGKDGKCQPHLFKPQDIARLNKAFPEMILPDILEIDSADPPYHIEELKARLYAEACAVHGQYDIHLPTKWITARDKVLKRNATHIDYKAFEDDCAQCGVTGSAVRSLLGMLSRQGRLVNYGADEKLRDVVVLNAEWLMKAFAAVRRDRCDPPEAASDLPETQRPACYRAGFLHRDRLPLIWQDYPKDKHDLLLRLMIRHGLSYAITDDEWLVPELVPYEQPDLPWDDLNGDHSAAVDEFAHRPLVQYCQFGTEYDDEHDLDIIPGLMAVITQRSSYYFTKRDWFWQEGLFLRHPTDGTEALITLPKARLLRIETRGRYPGDLMSAMRGVIEEVIHERWPAAKQAKKPLYQFEVPCPEEDCEAKHLVSTLRKIEIEENAGASVRCTEGHVKSVSQLLRGLRPPLAPEWADKLDRKIDGVSEKMDRQFGFLTGIQKELDQLLTDNADVKLCLNFLIAAETVQRPPRLYHLQPLDFDVSDPKPILGTALRPHMVRMTVWCEWEHRPVPEAYVDIPVDTKLGGFLQRHGRQLLKIVTAGVAVQTGVSGFQLAAGAPLGELVTFMQNLVKLAPTNADFHRELRETAIEEDSEMLVERHESANETDVEFAGLLRQAAEKGGMKQMLCQDGRWRWVSPLAALRLDPAEPRMALEPMQAMPTSDVPKETVTVDVSRELLE